jgi:tyrosine-protein phosphatase non-receptor type 23
LYISESIQFQSNIFIFIGSLASSIDESSVREMQHLVGKVEEMRQQRAMLSTQLRESIFQDDITRQLVTRTGESLDTIFSQELQKHQKYVSMQTKLLFIWH